MTHFFPTSARSLVLTVAVIAAFAQMASAQVGGGQDYGVGTGQYVGASNAAVFFMVGLVVGMVGGIALLFMALVRRERQTLEENHEFEALMEALDDAQGDLEGENNPFSSNPQQNRSAEYTEPVDPWERPVDWWKKSDDDQ